MRNKTRQPGHQLNQIECVLFNITAMSSSDHKDERSDNVPQIPNGKVDLAAQSKDEEKRKVATRESSLDSHNSDQKYRYRNSGTFFKLEVN